MKSSSTSSQRLPTKKGMTTSHYLGKGKNVERVKDPFDLPEDAPVEAFIDNFNMMAVNCRSNDIRSKAPRTWSQGFQNFHRVSLPEIQKHGDILSMNTTGRPPIESIKQTENKENDVNKSETNPNYYARSNEIAPPRTIHRVEKHLAKEREQLVKEFLKSYNDPTTLSSPKSSRGFRSHRASRHGIRYSGSSSGLFTPNDQNFEKYERNLMSRGKDRNEIVANMIVSKLKQPDRPIYTRQDHERTYQMTLKKIKTATDHIPLHSHLTIPSSCNLCCHGDSQFCMSYSCLLYTSPSPRDQA
eukprot:TRINITY_DN14300_c0_g1_i2.p1 TRINITY_DN14300_c0_g1~~TRINITY_DN14300_c0_g1_i2.p1  ORF type:complete len:300 (-),score=17.27 TRINITY_DN14300_c0_g1_i2:80-979(-)